MALVRSIITDAYTELGVLQGGETPNAQMSALALLRFQNQLDAWQADNLTLFNFSRTTYTLPASTQTRTIGPSGQITVAANPIYINGINYVVPGSSPGVETPMGRMDNDAYMNLSIKSLSSTLPTQWFFNPGATNGTLTFWPVESGDIEIAIYIYFGVPVPVTLGDDVIGPPGYQEAFMYQLALRLMQPMGVPASSVPLLVGPDGFAAQSFARIKRPNTQPGLLGVDQALVPTYGGGYNILNDNTSAPSNR